MKKVNRAKARDEPAKAKKLLENKPDLSFNHLVKERYP
jgi:hypothetical protein